MGFFFSPQCSITPIVWLVPCLERGLVDMTPYGAVRDLSRVRSKFRLVCTTHSSSSLSIKHTLGLLESSLACWTSGDEGLLKLQFACMLLGNEGFGTSYELWSFGTERLWSRFCSWTAASSSVEAAYFFLISFPIPSQFDMANYRQES